MRKPSIALAGFPLLACLLCGVPARAQDPGAAVATPSPAAPTAAAAKPTGAAAVQFGDETLAAGDRELLARAAILVSRWAMVQRIVQAVRAQEAAPLAAERVQAIDQAWQRGGDPQGLATSLARNDCALALQSLVGANPGYAEAFVTDDQGALVCMSQRTSDYYQADEEVWTRGYAGGAGAIYVAPKELESSTGLELVHIAVPVRSGGKVIGVLVAGRIVAPG